MDTGLRAHRTHEPSMPVRPGGAVHDDAVDAEVELGANPGGRTCEPVIGDDLTEPFEGLGVTDGVGSSGETGDRVGSRNLVKRTGSHRFVDTRRSP